MSRRPPREERSRRTQGQLAWERPTRPIPGPTPLQLRLLASLGAVHVPETKAAAHELIERLMWERRLIPPPPPKAPGSMTAPTR